MKTNNLFKLAIAISVFFAISSAEAQSIRVGAMGGYSVGQASDFTSFNATVDASVYLFDIKETTEIGLSTGYTRYFGKSYEVSGITVDGEDFSFIPVTVSGRGLFSESIVYTADVGYAIGLDGIDGGLFYQAKLGWTNSAVDVFGFFRGISSGDSDLNVLGLGVSFKVL